MSFKSLLSFIGTVFIVECAIEVLRFGIYTVWHKTFPDTILLTHPNRFIYWFINCLESLSVITLLYFKVNVLVTALSVLCLIFVVKYVATLIESKVS